MLALLLLSLACCHAAIVDQAVLLVPQHYLSVQDCHWPVNLTQYQGEIVVRVAKNRNVILRAKQLRHEIWGQSRATVDVKLPEKDLGDYLAAANVTDYSVMIPDLAQAVYESYPQEEPEDQLSAQDEVFFKEYRRLETIYAWYDLVAETYKDLVTIEEVGVTAEGRSIKALYIDISSRHGQQNPKNKTIVIAAGIHAREWIGTSSANYVLYQLLTNYGTDKQETRYLNQVNILIVPVSNPDGYSYSWSGDRLWRKNRQATYMKGCTGVDIDHSFDYHWQISDDTMWPCDEDYSGEAPFEAREAKMFDSYFNQTKLHLKIYGYIDLHSYAQEILYPYAYSCEELPRDEENLIELAYGLSKAIRLTSGKTYQVAAACQDKNVDLTPGLGSGSSLDYMYSKRAHWAFQVKLRDSGNHGFLLPSKYITPVGDEVYAAIKYFLDFILNPDL